MLEKELIEKYSLKEKISFLDWTLGKDIRCKEYDNSLNKVKDLAIRYFPAIITIGGGVTSHILKTPIPLLITSAISLGYIIEMREHYKQDISFENLDKVSKSFNETADKNHITHVAYQLVADEVIKKLDNLKINKIENNNYVNKIESMNENYLSKKKIDPDFKIDLFPQTN